MIRRLVLLLLLCGGTAHAQGALRNHDSDAPVDVASDRLELQERANRAILTGNVRVTQGNLSLTAPRMTAAYLPGAGGGDPQLQRLDAGGGVTLTSPGETVRANSAIYDLNNRLVTMIGGVTVVRGTNRVGGGRLVYNLSTGRYTLDGAAVSGGPGAATGTGGRVTGRFSVPRRQGQ